MDFKAKEGDNNKQKKTKPSRFGALKKQEPMNSLSLYMYFFAFTMYLLVHNSISKMRSSECSGSNSVLIIIISNIVRKKIFKDV